MKITDVKVADVRGNFLWPLIKIEMDEGIYCYGEPGDYTPRSDYVLPTKELIFHLKKRFSVKTP